jgi:hypothetical protein
MVRVLGTLGSGGPALVLRARRGDFIPVVAVAGGIAVAEVVAVAGGIAAAEVVAVADEVSVSLKTAFSNNVLNAAARRATSRRWLSAMASFPCKAFRRLDRWSDASIAAARYMVHDGHGISRTAGTICRLPAFDEVGLSFDFSSLWWWSRHFGRILSLRISAGRGRALLFHQSA